MKFSCSALMASLCLAASTTINVAAFVPSSGRNVAFVPSSRSTTPSINSANARRSIVQTNMANVNKLSDPMPELLNDVDVFIFDCDGVIWRGDSLIDGIPETLDKLRKLGKKMFFVTNNSTKSRAGYKKKFDSLGLNIPPEEIFSSSFAAAAYLEQTKFKESGKKVYVIGEIGIPDELDLIGVPYIGGPADAGKEPNMGPGGKLIVDENVGAVVVGFDRTINYYKIQYAQLCINELGAEFIATNLDAVTHLTDAQEWAGNGSMVGAIKGCTGQEPTVVGKPSPLMIDYLAQTLGLEKNRICMVGDRLDTDILFGTDNGLKSLLVLSGVTTEEKLLSPDNTITPDYYADTINDFFMNGAAQQQQPQQQEEVSMHSGAMNNYLDSLSRATGSSSSPPQTETSVSAPASVNSFEAFLQNQAQTEV